ncbi:phage portal protein [Dechloromonas denitrificans]|uniref:phage portal protein n=1 Tax=Dechloromonas denitrificans TaxID=281362 RepID=UPI001CF89D5C|nr:phage portal protein [Dechloromonas denitrificans]UCV02281.1 phage portal protein [Dechloromonas denitrificans]
MKKRKNYGRSPAPAQVETMAAAPGGSMEAFAFGDPEAVLDRREIIDYLECPDAGKWYEPPISLDGLARSSRSAVHHASAMIVKRNILVSCFEDTPLLTKTDFAAWAHEFLIFGNAYMERRDSRMGSPLALKPTKAKYTRRGKDDGQYWFIPRFNEEHEFRKGSIFHLMETDINQDIYGLPEYIPALHSAWLNESATLFRRKYYKNGSHAGFILYMTDTAQKQEDVDKLRQALKDSKGPGNFRNLFMYAPGGKEKGIQLIPVSEVAAKDEFLNIKNVTRDDQLAAHRVPPQLMGIIPHNTGGFGDAETAAKVFSANEITPLQERMKELNTWLGMEVIKFRPYVLAASEPPPKNPAA